MKDESVGGEVLRDNKYSEGLNPREVNLFSTLIYMKVVEVV